MKYLNIILFALIVTTSAFAQKLPKIKGSKNVVVSTRKFDSVKALIVSGKIKLHLIQSDTCKLVINADGNLHETVVSTIANGTLSIALTHRIVRKKRFELIFYIDTLQSITLTEHSKVKASGTFSTDTLRIKLSDASQLLDFNSDAKMVDINCDDNVKLEAKLNTSQIIAQTAGNSKLDLTIKTAKIACTSSDTSKINLIGTTVENKLAASDNSKIQTKDCISDAIEVIARDKSKISTLSKDTLSIDASGSSEILSYGKGVITIKTFKENAILRKKE